MKRLARESLEAMRNKPQTKMVTCPQCGELLDKRSLVQHLINMPIGHRRDAAGKPKEDTE